MKDRIPLKLRIKPAELKVQLSVTMAVAREPRKAQLGLCREIG